MSVALAPLARIGSATAVILHQLSEWHTRANKNASSFQIARIRAALSNTPPCPSAAMGQIAPRRTASLPTSRLSASSILALIRPVRLPTKKVNKEDLKIRSGLQVWGTSMLVRGSSLMTWHRRSLSPRRAMRRIRTKQLKTMMSLAEGDFWIYLMDCKGMHLSNARKPRSSQHRLRGSCMTILLTLMLMLVLEDRALKAFLEVLRGSKNC